MPYDYSNVDWGVPDTKWIEREGAKILEHYVERAWNDPRQALVDYYNDQTYLPLLGRVSKRAWQMVQRAKRALEPGGGPDPPRDSNRPRKIPKRSKPRVDPDPEPTQQEEEKDPEMVHPMSADTTISCKYLPDVKLGKFAKGGYKGDSCKEQDLEDKYYHEEYYDEVINTSRNRKRMSALGVSTWPATIATAGGDISKLPVPTGGLLQLNSVRQLEKIWVTRYGYTDPTYETTSPDGVLNAADAHSLTVLFSQNIDLTFKNMTQNATGDGFSTTNAFMNIYVVQFTKNVRKFALDFPSSELIRRINSGWPGAFGTIGGSGSSYPAQVDQLSHVSWSRNQFLKEHTKVVARRKFCLCPGQEANLNISLPQKQILSHAYKLKAIVGDVTSGPITYRWNPVCFKKGEFAIVFDCIGGIISDGTNVNTEECRVAVRSCVKWSHARLTSKGETTARVSNTEIADIGGVVATDLDVAHPL